MSLGNVVPSDFDARLEEGLGHLRYVHAQEVGNFLGHRVVRQRGLVAVALLLELHVAEEERGGDDAEERIDIFLVQTHDGHGFECLLELAHIIYARDGQATV